MLFDRLPELVQLEILEYCSFTDLRHLRLADSEHSQLRTIKQRVQRRVTIPKDEFKNTQKVNKLALQVENLELTKILQIQTAVHPVPHSLCTAVQGLHHLRELKLTGCLQVDDQHVSTLCCGLFSLQALSLSYTKVTSVGCVFICKLNLLERLTLRCCNGIDDEAMQHITTMSSLKVLDVTHCRYITDAGFKNIQRLIHLAELVVRGCDISTEAFIYIARVQQLVKLDASHTNIQDPAIAHIRKLGNLQKLNIETCPLLTDRCVEDLSMMSSLESLNVYGCQNISDTGRLSHIGEVNTNQLILSSHMFRVYYSTRRRYFIEIK